tara:strand:+ start:221 stop:955 length:735 start_codon:yes stop_codon:yes gene_type:complete
MKNMHHFAKAGNPPESFKSAWVLLLLAVFSACSDSSKSSNNITADASTQSEELSHHTGSKDDQASEYEVRRQQWVQQFDLDTNGFLDVSEREAMRKTPKPRGKSFRRGKGGENEKKGKEGVRFDAPDHWVEKYDKDGDGGLSGEESEKGYWSERKRLFDLYDRNGDETLSPTEIAKLASDIDEGVYESWDHFVATTTLKDHAAKAGVSQPRLDARQREWLQSDLDGDGKASADELKRIRSLAKP